MKNSKRLLAAVLCLAMCSSFFPGVVFADGDEDISGGEETGFIESVNEEPSYEEPFDEEPAPEEFTQPTDPNAADPEENISPESSVVSPSVQEENNPADPTQAEEPDTPSADEPKDTIPLTDTETEDLNDTEEAGVQQEDPSSDEEADPEEEDNQDRENEEVLIEEFYRGCGSVGGEVNNSELLTGYIQQRINSAKGMPFASNYAGKILAQASPAQAAIYDVLKEGVVQIAAGERSSTVFTGIVSDLGLPQIQFTAAELGFDAITDENKSEALFRALDRAGINGIDGAINALLSDCPYELYWFDKAHTDSEGYGDAYSYAYSYARSSSLLVLRNYEFALAVSADYAEAGDYHTVSSAHAARINTALDTAREIVQGAEGLDDRGKLDWYRSAICTLTSYNSAAAGNPATPYGDPWQLIYVFDGDDSTNVVCEGYSKAFQYLCELSSFSGFVQCYTVTGFTSEGHMWNIVNLNGKRYLADITNCDSGTVGEPAQLFLTGYDSGSVTEGYVFQCIGDSIRYVYDADSIATYGTENLTLAAKSEQEPVVTGITNGMRWELGMLSEENGWLNVAHMIDAGISFELSELKLGIAGFTSELAADLVIPNEIEEHPVTVLLDAFAGCSWLESVTFPASLATVFPNAFSNCPALREFRVPENGAGYWTNDGILYQSTGAGNMLLHYPPAKGGESYTVSEGTAGIGSRAFEDSTYLKSLVLPASITEIRTYAFWNSSVDALFYTGTQEQWASLVISDGNSAIAELNPIFVSGFYADPDVSLYSFLDFPSLRVLCERITAGEKCILNYIGSKPLVIEESLHIPFDLQVYTDIVIPENVNLTVGSLLDHASGGLSLQGTMTLEDGSTVILTPECWSKDLDIRFQGDSVLKLQYSIGSAEEANAVFAAEAILNEHVLQCYDINTDYNLMHDVALQYHEYVYLWGNVTVAQGATMTLEEGALLHPYASGSLRVNGALINEGTIHVFYYPDKLVLGESGSYSGSGIIQVSDVTNPDSWLTGFDLSKFDKTVVGGNWTNYTLISILCGDAIIWELSGNVLTLTGSGQMYDYKEDNVPWRNYKEEIEILVVQEGIEGLGRLAFANLPNLREARLPSTLSYIAYGAFLNDTALTSADLPANLRYVGGQAFQNTGLRAVSLPQSIVAIEYNTFADCTSLSSIELPDRLASIGWEALKGTALEEIDIPLSLSHVEQYAFDSCGNLRTVNYDGTREDRDRNLTIEETGNDALLNATWRYRFSCGENAYWTYDEASGELTIYGIGEIWDYRNVDRSAEGAADRTTDAPWWQWQDSMKHLTISEGITGIGASAFYGMRALEELILPASLSHIGSFAFTGCDSLRSVNYSGTKADWDALVIGEGNECLTGVDILYGGENLLAKLADAVSGETVDTLPVNGSAQILVTLAGADISADRLSFAVNDPSVLSVDANGTVLAKQVGSAVITVTLKESLFGQSVEILVRVYDDTNDIQLAAPTSFLITEDADAVAAAVKNKTPLTADIILKTPNEKKGVYKYTSSDTGVATVAEKADFSGATVTLKGAGEATITIAPSAKGSTIAPVTVTVKVQDFKPRLGVTSVTLDPMLSEGVTVPLVESYGAKIAEVTLKQSSGAAIPGVICSYSDGMLTLETESSTVATETYKNAVLTVKCDGIAEAYSYKLNITVKKSKDPAVTVKQTAKMNIFYSDAAAQLNVTAKNAEITKIECVEHGFYDLTWAYDGLVDVAIRENYSLSAASQQVTLKITVAGRRDPITQTVKITTVTTAPKLVATPASGTLAKGMGAETVTFNVINQTTGEEVDLTNAGLSVPSGYQVTVDSSENSLKLKGTASGTVKLGLSIPGWTGSATVSYKLTVKNITPKLKLGATTLTLNSAFADAKVSTTMGTDAANVGITGLTEVSFAGKAADEAEADKIGLSFENGMLVASLLSSNVKAGSYKFTVTGDCESGDELSATVTVKVAGTVPKVSVASSKLSLNKKYWGVETVSTAVKLSTKSGYVITGLSGNSADYGYEFDPQTLMLTVWLLKQTPTSNTLTLTPRVIETASGTANTADLTPITLTITATDKAATAKLAVSGTLDPIVRGKAVTITPTLQNVSGTITGVTAPAGYIAVLSVNAKGAQIIQLFLDRGTAVSNGKVSVPITLEINDSNVKTVSATAAVTVKQSAVKVTASAAQQVYQGATNPTATFTVKLSSPAGAAIESVRLADTVTDQVRNCIRNITWTVAGDTATATVSFRNLSTLKAGSSFKIPVVVTPEDCATGITLKPNADLSFKVGK